jgi:hypothetical protein
MRERARSVIVRAHETPLRVHHCEPGQRDALRRRDFRHWAARLGASNGRCRGLELYFQNPQFGYYFLVLTSQRLLQNIARAERIIEQNKMEIARLEGIIEQNSIKQQAGSLGPML